LDVLALVGAVWVVGYVITCAVWPYRRCGRCEGTGKRRSPSGKAWRPCRRCEENGSTATLSGRDPAGASTCPGLGGSIGRPLRGGQRPRSTDRGFRAGVG
jgi:hypothetical protein